MMNQPSHGMISRLRSYFLAGILVSVPIGITIWFCVSLVAYIDERIIPLIPKRFNPEIYLANRFGLEWDIPGLGVVILLISLTLVGALATGFAGRWLVHKGEQIMEGMPFVRSIYRVSKKLIQTVFSNQSQAFRKAAMIEYPRKGCWSMGFITADPAEARLAKTAGANDENPMVSVFVPTTPNPTSGFLLFLPKSEVKILDMPVEEAFQLLISVGIVSDEKKLNQQTDSLMPKGKK